MLLLLFVGLAAASSHRYQQQTQSFDNGFGAPAPQTRPIFGGRPAGGRIPDSPVLEFGASRPLPPPGSPSQSQDCITQPGQWGPCSASCGGGIRRRSLIIVKQPSGYGARCPSLHDESENCNSHPCPIDCEVEQGQFGECSVTCGQGTQTKVDIIIREAKYGGLACPAPESLITTIACPNLPPCPVPVHCEIQFGQYSACSASCGLGFKSRSAFIVTQPANGGAPCPPLSQLTDTVTCQERPCLETFDCLYIQSEWGECSATCGQGYRKRRTWILSQPQNGGAPCPPGEYEQQPCNAGPCPEKQDCEVAWGQFSQCSATCGGGQQGLIGQIIRPASPDGIPCPSQYDLRISRNCNDQQCLQQEIRDCKIAYGEYSECSATCGGGYRFRKGYIQVQPLNGGLACPAPETLLERIECNSVPCPAKIDCEVRREYWSECSRPCGGGVQTRSVQILTQPQNGGLPCPSKLFESRPCNSEPCGYN